MILRTVGRLSFFGIDMSDPLVSPAAVSSVSAAPSHATDPVGLAWLVTARWATLAAAGGTVIAGRQALGVQLAVIQVVAVLAAIVLSNLWLWWRIRSQRTPVTATAGALVCVDVALLSWLLLKSGGVLNPASVFYLVQIVLAALVLGRTWTWVVTAVSIAGYGALFLTPTDELRAAQVMHPEIALHMRGMWIAFALTALITAVLVTRLAVAVERRDLALDGLRDRSARASRLTGLTTVVAGAAHELNTPLATIAVAAHELERTIQTRGYDRDLADDARLIRAEIDRCRSILDQMAGRIAEPLGEAPRPTSVSEIVTASVARFNASERTRIAWGPSLETVVVWPAGVVAQALTNLLRNALQASDEGRVEIAAAGARNEERLRITITDRGKGMSPEELARAGEPFFTTKPAGAGTGLGLFVARSTIEQLGGELAVSSRLDTGTTVTIVLPRNVLQFAGASRE
jgi:two-component system sensor histidine kinase RegB